MLDLGWEYVPYMTSLTTAGSNVSPTGPPAAAFKGVDALGMIKDFGGGIPDIETMEAMITFKHKIGDVPFKWTFHGMENLNSFNIPVEARRLTRVPTPLLQPIRLLGS